MLVTVTCVGFGIALASKIQTGTRGAESRARWGEKVKGMGMKYDEKTRHDAELLTGDRTVRYR